MINATTNVGIRTTAGYSSLSYLHRFPVNILKVDRSFVGRMAIDEESLGIVETILTLASGLKMSVRISPLLFKVFKVIEDRDGAKLIMSPSAASSTA